MTEIMVEVDIISDLSNSPTIWQHYSPFVDDGREYKKFANDMIMDFRVGVEPGLGFHAFEDQFLSTKPLPSVHHIHVHFLHTSQTWTINV